MPRRIPDPRSGAVVRDLRRRVERLTVLGQRDRARIMEQELQLLVLTERMAKLEDRLSELD